MIKLPINRITHAAVEGIDSKGTRVKARRLLAQDRDGSGLDQCGNSGSGENWLDSGYIIL